MMKSTVTSLILFFFLHFSTQTLAATCPKGCDCVPDPVMLTQQLVVCHWSPEVHDDVIVGDNVRSVHITCSDGFSLIAELFSQLNAVQQLKIENCHNADMVQMFTFLPNLRSLHLEKVNRVNQPLLLAEETFQPLGRLEKLSLVDSRLERLPSSIFCHLKNLQVANLSSNALTSLKTETTCVASQLIIADFSHNSLTKLGGYLHVMPALRHLSLTNNQLTSLPLQALIAISHLQYLDVEGNEIDNVEALPDTLIYINMAYNRLNVIPTPISTLPLLVSLNLSHNTLEESSPAVINSNVLESLDLSFNRISRLPVRLVPNAHPSLVHLHVEGNLIQNLLPADLANLTKLNTLNLASNRLQVLRDDTFSGLSSLQNLQLQNNSLDTIEQSAFVDLSIDELNLSYNQFMEAPHALGRLYKLKKLDLSHNRISKLFQFVFNKIPHLHTVSLKFNELQSIGPYIFSDSSHLSHVDMSHNQISIMFKDCFSKCPQLKKLELNDNRLASLDDSLRSASSIRRLNISANRLTLLQWDSLPAKLEQLSADNNEIRLLTAAAPDSKLRSLSLQGNRIEQVSSEQLPNSLETLDLSHNVMRHVSHGTFSRKTAIRRIDLSHNLLENLRLEAVKVTEGVQTVSIDVVENPLDCGCEMEWIREDKSQHRLSLVTPEATKCRHVFRDKLIKVSELQEGDLLCKYDNVCEPECVCCQYANCDCKSICPLGCSCFRDASNNKNLVSCQHLNQTAMKMFSPSDVPMSSTHIYLSGLQLPIIRAHSFLGRRRLEQLHVNASNVRQIQAKAFHTLPALKLLDLSDNALETLNGEEFFKTSAISHLFLNGNRLKSVEKSLLEKFPDMKMLTLHNNDLTELSEAVASTPLHSVSLASNPFRCDCSSRFLAPTWIQDNMMKVVDVDRVFCEENVTKAFRENDTTVLSAYPPNVGHDIFRMSMNEFLRDYNRTICVPQQHGFFGQEPQSTVLMIVFIAACGFLFIAMILLAVSMARKTHTVINQRRYKASSSLNCSSSPGSSPLPIPLMNYDVFVSYSKMDEKMVVDSVCRRLEDDDYSLCLLHRDGPIYNHRVHTISDELISQMDSAQALILVLTRSFLENEWRTLQIKTSHQLFAKNRSKRLIAVFVDDGVDQNLLDDELGQMLRKNTCLRLSDPLFWTLLRSTLPNRISPPSDSSQIYSDMYGIVPSAMV